MAIRYDEQLSQELARTVKNYNAKIARLAGRKDAITPERISQKVLKERFTDRRELLREMAKLREFSKRGAENVVYLDSGVKTSRYEVGIYKKRIASTKASLTRKINKIQLSYKDDTGRQEEQDLELRTLIEKRNRLNVKFSELSKSQFYTNLKTIEVEDRDISRAIQFKENYINKILETLAYQGGVSPDDLERIKNTLNKVPAKKFWYNLVKGNGNLSNLLELYQMLKDGVNISQEMDGFVEAMMSQDDAQLYIENLAVEAMATPLMN